MDPVELTRLLLSIREGLAKRGIKSARTAAQIADVKDREVQTLWNILADGPVETIEFPGAGEPSDHVVGCTTHQPWSRHPDDAPRQPRRALWLGLWAHDSVEALSP